MVAATSRYMAGRRISKILGSTKTWLAAVAAAGLIAAILIGALTPELKDQTILYEVFKFSLTVVLGGVIAFAFRMAEAKRQTRDVRRRDLRDFYRRMLAAYNEAKKARRLLRARSHSDGEAVTIVRKDLDDLMDNLHSAQLEFEALRRESQVNRKLLREPEEMKALERHLGKAEKYLREVLKVHEAIGPSDPAVMPLGGESYRALLCFFNDRGQLAAKNVPPAECERFDTNFAEHAQAIRLLIVESDEEAAAED
jgi:hypothetical protein